MIFKKYFTMSKGFLTYFIKLKSFNHCIKIFYVGISGDYAAENFLDHLIEGKIVFNRRLTIGVPRKVPEFFSKSLYFYFTHICYYQYYK